jgi:hypothetical protein
MMWGAAPNLPLDKDVLLYPRVSQPGQLKNVSAELQAKEDGELVRTAKQLGWLPESEWTPEKGIGRIRQFPQDMAKSARLRMEDRPGFKLMLQAIVAGEARAVIAVDVDRLFRDKYGSESGKFIEMCERYQVIVITPTFIYDFHDPTHIKLFKDAVSRAWDYMQYQIYDRMIYHQNYLQATGRVGRGQNINAGYILDRDEHSPTFRHLIPYQAHAQVLLEMYQRYRELGNNLGRLYRELRARPFVFPDFPPDMDPRHVEALILTKVPGGYTIATRTGLRRMLCNTVYIGWMKNGDDVVRDEHGQPKICHKPIIPEDQFWNVFLRHSPYLPDGSPNPNLQQWRDRESQEPINAMLRFTLKSADPKRYRITAASLRHSAKKNCEGPTNPGQYIFYDPKDELATGKSYLTALEVDSVYWKLLYRHLKATKNYENYARAEQQVADTKEREKNEILAQIEACDRIVEKQKRKLVKIEASEEDEQEGRKKDKAAEEAERLLITAVKEEIASQLREKQRLEERLKTFLTTDTKYADSMLEWSKLLSGIEEEEDLEKYTTIEERQQLAEVFSTHMTMELLSQRVLCLTVYWRHPEWQAEQAFWLRTSMSSQRWTDEEKERFRAAYAIMTPLELLQAFPDRSWSALRHRSWLAGLKPLDMVGPLEGKISWNDYQRMLEYDVEAGQLTVRHCQASTNSTESAYHPKRAG